MKSTQGFIGFLRAFLAVATVAAYQVLAHHAIATPDDHGLGLAMALAPPLLLALGAAARSPRRARWLTLWMLGAGALWGARTPLAQHFEWGLYLEHVSFNLGMALVFGRTLAAGRTPLCTQFATMMRKPGGSGLKPAVARYTRQITLAWSVFFVAIAAISTLMFAFAPIVDWSTFANYLALPLVGAMFVGEHAVRRFMVPGEAQAGMMEAIRAYRARSCATPPHRSQLQ
ncbi:putative membrane protein [Paraburkholderia bannensis]|uniref:Putative membrane protein n=1 Tax=Paraburkholderia bannensis TaxID=765414 RepID=A0A7W9WVJ4_9BURK|nr:MULTISPECIES: hypothetical protein [Paraburkholderia]MBB3260844.1 putative membrane protein [Paraburkholderia sp. WP4_3_2]MBB6105749.1 putative membrane protein [Paraburkholderia bannensis]